MLAQWRMAYARSRSRHEVRIDDRDAVRWIARSKSRSLRRSAQARSTTRRLEGHRSASLAARAVPACVCWTRAGGDLLAGLRGAAAGADRARVGELACGRATQALADRAAGGCARVGQTRVRSTRVCHAAVIARHREHFELVPMSVLATQEIAELARIRAVAAGAILGCTGSADRVLKVARACAVSGIRSTGIVHSAIVRDRIVRARIV